MVTDDSHTVASIAQCPELSNYHAVHPKLMWHFVSTVLHLNKKTREKKKNVRFMRTGFLFFFFLFTILPGFGIEVTLIKIHWRNECMNEWVNPFQKMLGVYSRSYINAIKNDFTLNTESSKNVSWGILNKLHHAIRLHWGGEIMF